MKNTFYICTLASLFLVSSCYESTEKNETTSSKEIEKKDNPSSKNSNSMDSYDDSSSSESTNDGVESKNLKETGNKSEKSKVGGSGDGQQMDTKVESNGSGDQSETSKSSSSSYTVQSTKDEAPSFNIHEYKKLNSFLGKYVSNGHVNYASIKSNKSELMAIVNEFESTDPSSSWSKDEKLAFWINAYNVFTIKLIVDNYPTSSITKITAKPWDKKFIEIGGTTYSLNGIETDIIRKKFNEPRIHFALNCASESCPILLNKAYKPGTLNSQLTTQTKAFLNDATKNDFSSKKSIEISSIFDWYKEDFSSSGGVIAFINKYKGTDYDSPKISYMEYSWDLNK